MSDKEDNGGCGMFLFCLALLFVILKLAGVVTWSWWLVLLPVWIVPAFGVAVVVGIAAVCIIVVLAIVAVMVAIELAERRRRRR